MKRTILLSYCCLLLFSCLPVPGQPEGEETYGWFSMSLVVNMIIEKERMVGTTCIKVNSIPLKDVTLAVSFPPQVKLIDGALTWRGDLGPEMKQCLEVIFASKTDLNEWSQPIRAHMEGVYEGKRVSEDKTWSNENYLELKKWSKEVEEKRKHQDKASVWERLCRFCRGEGF